MKIYLAARYSRHKELRGYADELEKLGHVVTSRWINGSHQVTTEEMENGYAKEKREQFAQDDYEDLKAAACCISFTEPQYSTASRGGRHVEFGIALASKMIVFVVGYRENVFHCLPNVLFFETWQEALEQFK